MNKRFERTLKQWEEWIEENLWLQVVAVVLTLVVVLLVIAGWDPLRVLSPPLPVQIVAAEKSVRIDEERLAELVATLNKNEAIYISDGENGAWYCAFPGGTRAYVSTKEQVADRAMLHPYQRICQQSDGRWMGCGK